MKQRQGRGIPWLAIMIALPIVACAAKTTARLHPDFANRRGQISTVGLVPAEAHFKLLTFQGDNPPLVDDETHVREQLPQLLKASLESCGFTVHDPVTVDSAAGESPDLRFQVSQAKQSLAVAQRETYVPHAWAPVSAAKNYRRSLGPMVGAIADRDSADALLFSDIEGFKKSGGEIAKDLAKSPIMTVVSLGALHQPTEGAVLFVALVDGTSGDILWQNVSATTSDYADPQVLGTLVGHAFNAFPK